MSGDDTMRGEPEDTVVTALPQEIHLMTVPEYVRAVDLFGWESTELIEGVVYDMPAEKNRHAMTVRNVGLALEAAFAPHRVFFSGSVDLSPLSMPEPDVRVIDGDIELDPDGYMPASAITLVVEVSVTTLSHDLGPKLGTYAKTRIPEVCVIDPHPEAGLLLRHTDPAGGRYYTVQRFDVGENAEHLDVAPVRAGG
jgi:Uma2 family endonuclease